MIRHRRSPQLSRLLHRLRGFVSLDSGMGVSRRDLDSPDQCEVQLELDFGRTGITKGLAIKSLGKWGESQ